MLSPTLVDALNEQINKELSSSLAYMALHAYFDDSNLEGFAHWMRRQYMEEHGHAVKLFDYMSLGKAIVTAGIPSVAEIVERERVGIVAGDDAESFSDAIVYLFEHPDEVREFQRNALEATRDRHSWRSRAERLIDIMQAAGARLGAAGEEPV